MACDPTLDRMSLKIRLRGELLWVSDARCRPAHAGCLPERVLAAHTIVFPRSGVFVRHRGEERDVGDPNHVVFFNPDEPYRSSHPGGGGDDCDVVTIQPEALADAVRPWDPGVDDRLGRIFTFGSHATDPRTALLQRLVFERLARSGDDTSHLEHAVLGLVGRVVAEAYRVHGTRRIRPTSATALQHTGWVEGVKRILASEFRRGLSLAEVSDAVGCSPFHLCRIFKKQAGLSIHRYLNRIRLRTAVDAILDPGANLADLADSLGYSSHSHFTDAFRREFGVTPTVVRRVAAAASARELLLILESPETLLDAFVRVVPPPARTAPQAPPLLAKAAAEDPATTPYAFRGEPLDPCPYALPRVPLQPHAA
jgi:AraC family transcriptional regulator